MVSGKRITDLQVNKYKALRGEHSQEAAAAKTGISVASARRFEAVTVLEELQRRHPEQFGDSVLRTMQRRVGQWRAQHGQGREIYFAQEHPPGRMRCTWVST